MPTDLMFTHYSGDTFMPLKDLREDTARLVEPELRHFITMTEQAEQKAVDAIRDVVGKRYDVVNPDDGDILFLVHRDLPVLKSKGHLAVPAVKAPASKGGHGPRYVSTFTTEYDGQRISALGVHLVTAYKTADHSGKPDPSRLAEQVAQVNLMGQTMSRLGKGASLAIGSGDLNGSLPGRADLQERFDHYHLTTTAMETGDMTPTHGNARIDYAWTRDQDGRLSVRSQAVRRGPVWNTDHDPVDVWVTIA